MGAGGPIKSKRYRKTIKSKGEAQRFEATCRSKLIDSPTPKPKPKPKPTDRRRLCERVDCWGRLLGGSLSGIAPVLHHQVKAATCRAIDPKLADRIRAHLREHGAFSNCRDQFDEAVARAGLNLPAG